MEKYSGEDPRHKDARKWDVVSKLYRVRMNCKFDQYDKRFAWAVENEQEEVVVALAFARLLYPYRLAEDAKEQYEGYLKSHVENVSEYLLKKKDMKLLTYYVEHCIDNVDNLVY